MSKAFSKRDRQQPRGARQDTGSSRPDSGADILTDPGRWSISESYTDIEQSGSNGALTLRDGTRVAVVGGGPAGSLFAFFLLKDARLLGLEIAVDIYEPRSFGRCGPAGCNHCGGIVSESLVQILGTEGISLPEKVVQRGIDSYVMHLDVGEVRIEKPLREKRIAAVYRGNGPRNSEPSAMYGFDHYLLERAATSGATVKRQMVRGIERVAGRPRLALADGDQITYDVLVVASGVNSAITGLMAQPGHGYSPPKTAAAFICEFKLGSDVIEKKLDSSMHVFLLDLPGLEFAALIPKGDYLTLAMLGQSMDEELVNRFLNAPEVRACFPGGQVPATDCHCFPRLNVGRARHAFDDRIVFIGDSSVARLNKDGIGSAYRTAKAAANCIAMHGFSRRDFRRHYWPTCREIALDNGFGKLIFMVCRLIQKVRWIRLGIMRMTVLEQMHRPTQPRMSGVLWDVFTGSAPYTDVLRRTLHPVFICQLVWNLLVGPWSHMSGHKEELKTS